MQTYKLHIAKGKTYYCFKTGREEITLSDHWTTVKLKDSASDGYVKYMGKANLMKQIAKDEWKNIRMWQKIELDNSDIEVVRE